MASEQVMLDKSIKAFFHRSGLTSKDQLDCFNYVQSLYPEESICPSSSQGYCSLTVFVGCNKVIQFRPQGYRLDLEIACGARDVYGSFAPVIKYIGMIRTSGLCVYEMNRISGICFKEFRDRITSTPDKEQLATLCRDFANFHSRAWYQSPDKPIVLGMVGKSLKFRLEILSSHLPLKFQPTARNVLKNLQEIKKLPWVLTHGDIVAANIMVDRISAQLRGIVDWAEAETLPFGISLYGLEEILGQMTSKSFTYHPDADELRDMFWTELRRQIAELREPRVLEAVKLSRDLGVLLWYGIAFDNGAINRVVEEGKDDEEMNKLEAFLDLRKMQSVEVSKI